MSLDFTHEDRLRRSVVAGITRLYGYDTAGERVATWRQNGTELTIFLRDEGGRVLAELTTDPEQGESQSVETSYLYGGGRLLAQLDAGGEQEGVHVRFLLPDHLGSTRQIALAGGGVEPVEFEYLPFGAQYVGPTDPSSTHLFTGHERDGAAAPGATGLDYMHARYYSSGLGRFLSVDPVGGEVGSSQSWNGYSYVLNQPVSFIDPFGELWVKTTSSSAPYSWVDTCASGVTCHESVAARVGSNLVVYGSSSATDVTTLTPNAAGVVDMSALSGHADSGFTFKSGAASHLSVDAGAAFWNTAVQYQSANPGSQKLVVTDMGSADAKALPPHKTHDLGRSIDLRYQDASGSDVIGMSAAAAADVARTQSLVSIAVSEGFDQIYTGNITLFGGTGSSATERTHRNHLHLGFTIGKARRLFP